MNDDFSSLILLFDWTWAPIAMGGDDVRDVCDVCDVCSFENNANAFPSSVADGSPMTRRARIERTPLRAGRLDD